MRCSWERQQLGGSEVSSLLQLNGDKVSFVKNKEN